MTTRAEVELEIPARPAFLALARQVVAAAAAVEPRFRTERIDDLRLAVSEATTNAVAAHSSLDGPGRIRIGCRLDIDGECIHVEVTDSAGGFDPGAVPAVPNPEDPSRLDYEHGLGIPIMHDLADETEIRDIGGGTAVRLVVYRSASAASERP